MSTGDSKERESWVEKQTAHYEELTRQRSSLKNETNNDKSTVKQQSSDEDDNDDEFGNYSDASFDDDLNVQPINDHQKQQSEEDLIQDTIDSLFDVQPVDSNFKDNTNNDPKDLLNDRSKIIYEQLICLPIENNHDITWSNSHVREVLYTVLNIQDSASSLDTVSLGDTPKNSIRGGKNYGESTSVQDQFVSDRTLFTKLLNKINSTIQECIMKYKDADENNDALMIVDLQETRTNLITDISTISDNKEIIKLCCELIDIKIKQAALLKDKQTYEQVVTNLVGHTQRIRRDEIEQYNKKHKRKYKINALSWSF